MPFVSSFQENKYIIDLSSAEFAQRVVKVKNLILSLIHEAIKR